MNRRIIFAALASTLVAATLTTPAHAEPSGTGWDGTPDVAVGGGSDTTYLVSQRLEVLYNGAPGCAMDTASGSVNKGKCIVNTATNVTKKQRTSNLAFLGLVSPHLVPATVTVAVNIGDAAFDGNRVVQSVIPSNINVSAIAGDTFTGSNGFFVGQAITFDTTGGSAGLAVDTVYYVVARSSSTFKVSATQGGAAISPGAGTPTILASIAFASVGANVASAASAGTITPVDSAPTNGNYDHDVMVSAAAIGSGAGVNSLLPTGTQYNPNIDFARSSRGPSGTEANDTTFWGYARDGIAVLTFGSRTGYALSTQDLKDIYGCTKTDWGTINQKDPVTGAPIANSFYPAGPIIPWDMNPSSGTQATFTSKISPTTFGSCVRKLETGIAPFENDVKPILADPGPNGVAGDADDDESNYVWWMSYGNWLKYPYTKNGCIDGNVASINAATGVVTCASAVVNSNLVKFDNKEPGPGNILDSTYTFMRTLFHVTRESDADCVNPTIDVDPNTAGIQEANACNLNGDTFGADTGKGGAVREFTEWLCKPGNHATNSVTARNYRNEIVAALNAEGFQQLSPAVANLRTPGYACAVVTA